MRDAVREPRVDLIARFPRKHRSRRPTHSMKKILLVAFALYATPVLAGGKSKPQSAKTQAHADRAAKDAGKTNDAHLAASRQKLAEQRQKQADQQRKKEAAKPRR